MKRVKIIYIVSKIDKALAFEWISESLDRSRFDLSFVLIGNSNTPMAEFLTQTGITFYEVPYFSKKNIPAAFLKTFYYLLRNKPDVIHAHLFEANLIGLTAAWMLGIKKRIFTRHHATLHYREYPSGLKWDKWCNAIATGIVAISQNVYEILVHADGATKSKVHLIHHGFNIATFNNVTLERINAVRRKHITHQGAFPVVGVIARYTAWKGVQYIIEAFAMIKIKYPKAHLVLANAQGDYATTIKSLLKNLPPQSYTEIRFEQDLGALYKIFDVYIHTPIDSESEAFGQTYIEALLSGVPSVFTLSGVATEFIRDGENALVVPYKSAEAISYAVERIIENEHERNLIVGNGKRIASDLFALPEMIQKLERLYERT